MKQRLRLKFGLPLFLLLMVLVGCIKKTTVVPPSERLLPAKSATRAELLQVLEQRSGQVETLKATVALDLARGGAGLLITGHMYVERRGQCSPRQIGVYSDRLIHGLKRLTDAVHAHGGLIFAELSHAGSQSVMPDIAPIAPSTTTNEIFGRKAQEISATDIHLVISAFADAARRCVAAGFDGIHLHGGNGYLIAQFSSPHTNRRNDEWGGDAARRDRFFLAVYDAVRQAVGPDFAVSARLGVADAIDKLKEINPATLAGEIVPSVATDLNPPVVSWDYYDGERWRPLGAEGDPDVLALRASGSVRWCRSGWLSTR